MDKKLIVTRIYDAPVELVWKIWTDPELVKRWWGPDKFTCPIAEIDFKEGGISLVAVQAPKEFGGKESFCTWKYEKIIHLQHIEFIQNLTDKDGNKANPANLGMPPDFPENIRTVVTFKPLSKDKTEMTVIQHADFGQMTKFAKMGMEQSFDKLSAIFLNSKLVKN